MAKYDGNRYYDRSPALEGFGYDYYIFKVVVNLYESILFSDSVSATARMLQNENLILREDVTTQAPQYLTDSVTFRDAVTTSVDISLYERLSLIEGELYVSVTANVAETLRLSETATSTVVANLDDVVSFLDTTSTHVVAELLEKFTITEIVDAMNMIDIFEKINFIDHEPIAAESNFYIGVSEAHDNRYDTWFMPFELVVDMVKSKIEYMPPTEHTEISVPYTDGEVIQDTTYRNRLFELVGYSVEGLSQSQKDALIQNITNYLDMTKHSYQKLTFQRNGLTFDVKYAGQAEFAEAPSWVKATIPFTVSPYGYKQFAEEFVGDGTIINNGKTDVGAIISVSEGCVNPNFRIGETEFLWEGTVPSEHVLIIDNEDKTCYLVDGFGNKTQAMTKLKKGYFFRVVPKGIKEALVTLNDSTKGKIKTMYRPRYLWAHE